MLAVLFFDQSHRHLHFLVPCYHATIYVHVSLPFKILKAISNLVGQNEMFYFKSNISLIINRFDCMILGSCASKIGLLGSSTQINPISLEIRVWGYLDSENVISSLNHLLA